MAYDRHIGTNNEAITYQKLNTIEDAVSELDPASSLSTITVNADFVSSDGSFARYELDKTGNEIYSYILEGNNVVISVIDLLNHVLFVEPVISIDEYLPNNDDSYGSLKCKGSGVGSSYEGPDNYPATDLYITNHN